MVLLGEVRYPISICYLEDSISGPHRSDCGEAISGREDFHILLPIHSKPLARGGAESKNDKPKHRQHPHSEHHTDI
jgi:hypothetical protein